jgi:hypothetical protein
MKKTAIVTAVHLSVLLGTIGGAWAEEANAVTMVCNVEGALVAPTGARDMKSTQAIALSRSGEIEMYVRFMSNPGKVQGSRTKAYTLTSEYLKFWTDDFVEYAVGLKTGELNAHGIVTSTSGNTTGVINMTGRCLIGTN